MRTLTSALEAAQNVRSPRARVTCTVSARGLAPTVPAVTWTQLIGNAAQSSFLPTALVGLTNSTLLHFRAAVGNIQKRTISNPTAAGGWAGGYANIVAVTATDIYAIRGAGADSGIIRLFYITSNNVHYVESTDAGANWGSPITVYSGGDAVNDLCAAYVDNATVANGPWFVGFSTYNGGTGVYTPRFGYFSGSWTTHAYDPNWRACGIAAYAAESSAHTCLLFRQSNNGISRLRTVAKEGSSYFPAETYDIDATPAGNFGLRLTWARLHNLPSLETMLLTYAESAKGSGLYTGIGHAWYTAVETLADEPIIFPDLKTNNAQARSAIAELNGSLYFANETFVYRGIPQAATSDTLTPISYVYDDGQFDLVFEPDIPTLYPGQLLTIRRTLSWGTDEGYEEIAALIARVETATDSCKVVAFDALGWLGVQHVRRQSILNTGSTYLAGAIRRLCARVGVPVTIDNATLESATALGFTLSPNENLRSAFYRLCSQANAWIVPANDGTFGLTAIKPATSTSGDYDDGGRSLPTGQSVIHHGSVINDLRRLSFSLVLGTFGADPADGAALAMAAGPVVANSRPLSNTYTNFRYNTTARVQAAAAAEATRQQRIPITATVQLNADLALELHDKITLTLSALGWSSTAFRIRRIREVYQRHTLTQTLFLGDTT